MRRPPERSRGRVPSTLVAPVRSPGRPGSFDCGRSCLAYRDSSCSIVAGHRSVPILRFWWTGGSEHGKPPVVQRHPGAVPAHAFQAGIDRANQVIL